MKKKNIWNLIFSFILCFIPNLYISSRFTFRVNEENVILTKETNIWLKHPIRNIYVIEEYNSVNVLN